MTPTSRKPYKGGCCTMRERECVNCGDFVLCLSGRDWCDGCELELALTLGVEVRDAPEE